MDNTKSLKNSRTLRPEVQASSPKKRSMAQKVVVRVKLGEGDGRKRKSEGPPPSDSWSWRKYGQKPIKGSPHPRGYYRCSSSKGCSAKKQVERSRADASVLIITYTSTHNHPAPATTNFIEEPAAEEEYNPTTPVPEEEEEEEAQMEQHRTRLKDNEEDSFHYSQSPFNTSEHIIINRPDDSYLFTETLGTSSSFLLDGEPLSCRYPHLMDFNSPPPNHKKENYDFYDELEELPHTSSFITYTFFKDTISVNSI